MRYLLDTHIALWFISDSRRLDRKTWELMCDEGDTWYLSIVSVWEVMLKHQAHPDQLEIDSFTFWRECDKTGFKLLQLDISHVFEAAALPVEGVHKDPFDRMLLAQARAEGLVLVTHDRAFAAYGDPHVMLV